MTTAKDAVKLEEMIRASGLSPRIELWVLSVELEIVESGPYGRNDLLALLIPDENEAADA